jgi:two-component system response regulator YesN
LKSVVIVDDEAIVRIGLKTMLSRDNGQYQVTGEAADGDAAWKIIEKNPPDVLITDIRMPVADGIELIRRIRSTGFSTHIIVLSSHDDFELVRQTMKLGAEDYLLKLDITSQKLDQVLQSITETSRANIIGEKENLKDVLPALRREFWKEAVARPINLSAEEWEKKKTAFQIMIDDRAFYCMLIQNHDLYRREGMSDEDQQAFDLALMSLIRETMEEYCNVEIPEVSLKEIVVFCSGKDSAFGEEQLRKAARRLLSTLQHYLNIMCTIGVSERQQDSAGFRNGFIQAQEALEHRFFGHLYNAVFFSDVKNDLLEQSEISILQLKPLLFQALETNDRLLLISFFEKVYGILQGKTVRSVQAVGIKYQLYYMVCDYYETYQINVQQLLLDNGDELRNWKENSSGQVLETWLENVKNRMLTYLQQSRKEIPIIVNRAKKYIEEHMTEDISLYQISQEVAISPSYLSTLFKKYAGSGVTEYIARMRISEAKKMLRETGKKVYQISEEVGWGNPQYFDRIFKRYVGVTPAEYRNHINL